MSGTLQQHEREKWNQRYQDGTQGNTAPDQFLADTFDRYIEPLFPGAGYALDVAGGTGRHAIFLADKGWKVKLIDIAEAGIANARMKAARLSGEIEFATEDVTKFRAQGPLYDIITVFFFLQREILPELIRALRPGGLMIYKTYTDAQSNFAGGPTNPAYLLKENELLHLFPGFHVLHYAELIRDCGMAEFAGRKPQ